MTAPNQTLDLLPEEQAIADEFGFDTDQADERRGLLARLAEVRALRTLGDPVSTLADSLIAMNLLGRLYDRMEADDDDA